MVYEDLLNKNTDRNLIITLSGSTRFFNEISHALKELTLEGFTVLSTPIFSQFDKNDQDLIDDPKYKNNALNVLMKVHLRKIRMSDIVVVINKDNYIGKSVQQEIKYAMNHHKTIIYKYGDEPPFWTQYLNTLCINNHTLIERHLNLDSYGTLLQSTSIMNGELISDPDKNIIVDWSGNYIIIDFSANKIICSSEPLLEDQIKEISSREKVIRKHTRTLVEELIILLIEKDIQNIRSNGFPRFKNIFDES